jgi:hypothetical protein
MVLLTLALAAPRNVSLADTTLDGWLDQLPEADALTARTIAEHLNDQWAVIRRDETARGALEYETGALEKARAAADSQGEARTEADAALAVAKAEAEEAESVRANLQTMRETQNTYEAAQRAYNLAAKAEETASAARDKAENDLNAAQSLAEETGGEYAAQSEAYALADERVQALREQAAALADSEDSDAAKTAEADLAAAERTHAAFASQLAQYAEQADRAKDAATSAQSQYDKASQDETAALESLEAAKDTLAEAESAFNALQVTYDELVAFEEEARLAALRTEAALDAAQTLSDNAAADLASRSEELALAETRYAEAADEADEAAAALAGLRAKWRQYSACIGAVLDTYPMPAMDLLARAEAAPELYAVYLNGTRLYLFRLEDIETIHEPFLSAVLLENKTTVELTRNGKGRMSVRYVGVDGKTHLQSLGADASAIVTGAYPVLAVDSQLRGMTQYLGEAAAVDTTTMHGLTTLVQFGIDNPIRHAPRPQ